MVEFLLFVHVLNMRPFVAKAFLHMVAYQLKALAVMMMIMMTKGYSYYSILRYYSRMTWLAVKKSGFANH